MTQPAQPEGELQELRERFRGFVFYCDGPTQERTLDRIMALIEPELARLRQQCADGWTHPNEKAEELNRLKAELAAEREELDELRTRWSELRAQRDLAQAELAATKAKLDEIKAITFSFVEAATLGQVQSASQAFALFGKIYQICDSTPPQAASGEARMSPRLCPRCGVTGDHTCWSADE